MATEYSARRFTATGIPLPEPMTSTEALLKCAHALRATARKTEALLALADVMDDGAPRPLDVAEGFAIAKANCKAQVEAADMIEALTQRLS